jgi:ectoine hydroxylase-related dioxygenase (phytanoyl-CoA dioxygenase family)
MTAENGAIKLWTGSQKCALDIKNRTGGLEKMNFVAETLEGPKGTVFVLDRRLLHQSLPNKTNCHRIPLAWLVSKLSVDLA